MEQKENTSEQKKLIIEFLKHIGVNTTFKEMDGLLIERNILLSDEKYKTVDEYKKSFKKYFKSGSFNSLQKTATTKQKWPLLNLTRQILKANQFKMTPIRKSNGYTKDGKKKFIRYFQINKITKKNKNE